MQEQKLALAAVYSSCACKCNHVWKPKSYFPEYTSDDKKHGVVHSRQTTPCLIHSITIIIFVCSSFFRKYYFVVIKEKLCYLEFCRDWEFIGSLCEDVRGRILIKAEHAWIITDATAKITDIIISVLIIKKCECYCLVSLCILHILFFFYNNATLLPRNSFSKSNKILLEYSLNATCNQQ